MLAGRTNFKDIMTATKHIIQKNGSDCGIAALAMLFDTSYASMKRLVMAYCSKHRHKFDGTTEDMDKAVALKMGAEIRVWYFTDDNRDELAYRLQGRRAILVVPAKGYPDGTELHAVYWDGRALFDPSPTQRYGKDGRLAFSKALRARVLTSEDRE